MLAERRSIARDAAEQVDVDYEELPAAANLSAACADGAPTVWEDAPDNVCFDWEIGDAAATDEAFANAAHVSSIDIVNNRLIPNAVARPSANRLYCLCPSHMAGYQRHPLPCPCR